MTKTVLMMTEDNSVLARQEQIVAQAREHGDDELVFVEEMALKGMRILRAVMVEVDLDEMTREWRVAPVELGKGGVKYQGVYVDPYELLLTRIKERRQ